MFFSVVCGCQVVMKITVIVIVNKKHSFIIEELIKTVVLFRALNILSVVFTTLKTNAIKLVKAARTKQS